MTPEEAEQRLEPLVRAALDEYLTALRQAVLTDSLTAAAFLPERWGDAAKTWLAAIRSLIFPALEDMFGEAFMAFARGAVVSDLPYREAYLERVFSRLRLFPEELFEEIRPEIAEAVAEGEPIDQIADRVEAFLDFDQAKDATGPDQARARAARAEINSIERQLEDPATPASDLAELRRRRRDAYEAEAEALDRYRYKAERIARTEAIGALNAGAFDGAAARARITGEVIYKEWLATSDDRTRPSHVLANGQIRPLLAPFDVGGSALMFPGDPTGPAHEVIQCRCTPLFHDADELTPDQLNTITAGAQVAMMWSGVLAPLDIPSGDGRTLATPMDGVRTRMSVPLLYQHATGEGHVNSVVVGTVSQVWTSDGFMYGAGTFLDSPDADFARDQLPARDGVSVDVDEVTVTYDPDTDQAVFLDWRLAAVTMVPIPAFDQARIALLADEGPRLLVSGHHAREESVTASIVPVYDPADFADPELTAWTPLQVTNDGRVFGHLAPWGECHIGIGDACTTAPPSATGYAYFHTGQVAVPDGRLAVGRITLGPGHADTRLGYRAATEHYDSTAAAVAVVRAGEDEFGIWLAGRLVDDVPSERVAELMRSPLSGDWRMIGNQLELVAALAVNTPGFMGPRALAASAEGAPLSLIWTNGQAVEPHLVDLTGFDYQRAAVAIVAELNADRTRRERRSVAVQRVLTMRRNDVLNRLGA